MIGKFYIAKSAFRKHRITTQHKNRGLRTSLHNTQSHDLRASLIEEILHFNDRCASHYRNISR